MSTSYSLVCWDCNVQLDLGKHLRDEKRPQDMRWYRLQGVIWETVLGQKMTHEEDCYLTWTALERFMFQHKRHRLEFTEDEGEVDGTSLIDPESMFDDEELAEILARWREGHS